jgi:hypothetical protein
MGATPIPALSQYPGGNTPAYNVTAAKVIKATPGILYRLIVINAGTTSGSLTINDNNATGGTNTAANAILSVLYSSLVVGTVYILEWPCLVGITVSAVPGGGTPQFALAYY